MGTIQRIKTIYRPPTGEETADYFSAVAQESPTIVHEARTTASSIYQTLVQTAGAVAKSPLTATRAVVSAVGNVLALPTIGLHYMAKGIDVVENKLIDGTRAKLAGVFGGGK